MTYDSKPQTLEHIKRVNELLTGFCKEMMIRSLNHDRTKLQSPEKEKFDEYTPKLKDSTYGSPEYKELLKGLGVALKHHYENNSHHPEHYSNGIDGMTLFDVVEMFYDWKAASERHSNGDFIGSIDINKKRFNMSDQLVNIFKNTSLVMPPPPSQLTK